MKREQTNGAAAPERARLPEERAASVLERAAALDAKRNSEIEVEQLREAAADAGISPDAFEQALREQMAEPLPAERSGGAALRVQDRPGPTFDMAEVAWYSGVLRDILGEEGRVSVSDVVEWRDERGITASVAPARSGVTVTVVAEARLRRRLLSIFLAILPALLFTFMVAIEEEEALLVFMGLLLGLFLALVGTAVGDRRQRKALAREVGRIRRQLQRVLGPGPERR